jgi:hypothetical protein
MKRRDYTIEIRDKRSRLYPGSTRWELAAGQIRRLLEELDRMERLLENEEFPESDLVACVPIRLVAIIEGYFRLVYANLIDHGDPYRANAAGFDLRFGIDTALSLERHSVSIGEFVAHLLPTNNLSDISANISKIISDDFFIRLKAKRLTLNRQLFLLEEWEQYADAILIDAINRLFQTRHLLCHELVPSHRVTLGEAGYYLSHAAEFIGISEAVVSDLLVSPATAPN